MRELITAPGLGNPERYASAVVAGGLVFTSGQVAICQEHPAVPEKFTDEVEVVLDHLEETLAAAGTGLDHLVKVLAFIDDLDRFDEFNEVYLRRLAGRGFPARTTVQVARFRGEKRLELEAVAALPGA